MATSKMHLFFRLAIGVLCVVVLARNAVAQEAPAEENQPAEIRVFSLTNAASVPLLDVIDSIFGDEKLRLAADERTNTVVVKAPPNVLQALEGVLQKLDDQAGQQRPRGGRPPNKPLSRAAQSGKVLEILNEVSGSSSVRALVPEGARVKKGDLIVQLDDSKLVAEAEKVRIEIEALQAESLAISKHDTSVDQAIRVDALEAALNVARLRREHFDAQWKLELAAAEGEITVAKEALDVAQMRQKRLQQLFQSGQASADEVQEAALASTGAKIEYELALAKMKLLVENERPLRIAELELQLKQAGWTLQQARTETKVQESAVHAKRSAVHVQLKLKSHQLARLEEQIAQCKVYAPAEGVVRYAPAIRKGSAIRQRQKLFALEP